MVSNFPWFFCNLYPFRWFVYSPRGKSGTYSSLADNQFRSAYHSIILETFEVFLILRNFLRILDFEGATRALQKVEVDRCLEY